MPIKKWLVQYVLTVFILFIIFASVQYLKGRGLEYSAVFGAIWALISASLYFSTRIYNYRKKIHCGLCNDLSEKNHRH